MRQLYYLKELYHKKILDEDEYKSASISYLNDMPLRNLAENVALIIILNYILKVINNEFN